MDTILSGSKDAEKRRKADCLVGEPRKRSRPGGWIGNAIVRVIKETSRSRSGRSVKRKPGPKEKGEAG